MNTETQIVKEMIDADIDRWIMRSEGHSLVIKLEAVFRESPVHMLDEFEKAVMAHFRKQVDWYALVTYIISKRENQSKILCILAAPAMGNIGCRQSCRIRSRRDY